MKEIPLTRGFVALVDDEDFEELARHRWCVRIFKPQSIYAGRAITTPDGPRRQQQVLMHRVILGDPPAAVSHIDGDGLNNQRSNLRVATAAQVQYSKRPLGRSSKYKGVWTQYGAWKARVRQNGVPNYLGTFRTEAEAALAYDRAAREHFGEFARLNFPDLENVN